MKLFPFRNYGAGDSKTLPVEKNLDSISFKVYKNTDRVKPDEKEKILIINCFSEFGCESIAIQFMIPIITEHCKDYYIICAGWHGREYLYRHLCDEFWEIKEEYQWLRDYGNAYNHKSSNLAKFEKTLRDYGIPYTGEMMSVMCLQNRCNDCQHIMSSEDEELVCEKCQSSNVHKSLLGNVSLYRKSIKRIPPPSQKMIEEAQKYLKPKSVGIFARGRLCYGRNLSLDFYKKLICLLESHGYNPIWLGEKQSVLPCPVDHIIDFSRMPESRNLELTLAIISQLEFTVQFWTASTRLASMVGTPWLLFESPDQIIGLGQEGKRIFLTTDDKKKKLVLSQFKTAQEDENQTLKVVNQAIEEMQADNWDNIIAMVSHPDIVKELSQKIDIWK